MDQVLAAATKDDADSQSALRTLCTPYNLLAIIERAMALRVVLGTQTETGGTRLSDAQILAGIQAVLTLSTMRLNWKDADYLDEFKRAARAGGGG